ncbi:MAG TPA: glucose-6-phosphate dehydrogenase, partial [Candidatus Paceibacterota bacterium]|nr:glucose-6-phosphate dehydrogenase [Candidatus Paceibacterota bacterium]
MQENGNSQNLLPTVFVIFGATGDLMRRKLTPGLFHLYREGHLPKLFQVVGFAKDGMDSESFRAMVEGIVRERVPDAPEEQIASFTQLFVYQ